MKYFCPSAVHYIFDTYAMVCVMICIKSIHYSLPFQSEPNRKYRMHAMHERAAAVNYSNHRSVYGEFSFPPGRYIVIPTTYECELEAQFTLRIFSSSRVLCKYGCVCVCVRACVRACVCVFIYNLATCLHAVCTEVSGEAVRGRDV